MSSLQTTTQDTLDRKSLRGWNALRLTPIRVDGDAIHTTSVTSSALHYQYVHIRRVRNMCADHADMR